jgi:hypothetical protein
MFSEMLKLTVAAIWLAIVVPFLVVVFYASCLAWVVIVLAILALL